MRQHAIGLRGCFGEVTTDGFDAASVLPGKLCGGLLAFTVVLLPKDVGIWRLPAAETLVTGHASVALFAILGAIFPDLF
ncbi:hypothetical protein ACFFOT_08045 [Cardiobacterium valvarum]|uniref:hypothetical protein n=1 Tax=Cardiobacterium valvarum TaxID=194702 RepID=UPI0011C045ED|nr:hypothetical protein [Cardiobacterium valvarum]